MQLDEAKQKKVAGWVADGMKLSEIQSRLGSELGVNMTYMEARFLVDDLKLKLKDPEPPKVTPTIGETPAVPPATPAADALVSPLSPDAPPAVGKVTMSVDQLAKPGAIVSGKVTFGDGQGADWFLDQTGRLGLAPHTAGYKPTAPDVQEFQVALQTELAKLGF